MQIIVRQSAVFAAAIMLLVSNHASAQHQGPGGSGQAAAVADAQSELPTVLVTAQKVTQSLEQVPASISVVGEEVFRDNGSKSFTDLQDYTPNVSISLSGSAGTFGIRGLTTPDTNTAFDPSVATIVDGVSYGRSNFLIGFFNDIDRVEVLRGPQGTLTGKNATAGLFSVVTRAPNSEFSIGGEFLTQSIGDYSVRPVLNVPLGDKAAARLSGIYDFGEGSRLENTFLNRDEDNTQQATTRIRLRYLANDSLTLDVGAFNSYQNADFNLFQFTTATQEMLDAARSVDPQTESRFDDKNSASFPSKEQARFVGTSLTADWQPPVFLQLIDPLVTSISGWARATTEHRDFDADFTALPFINDQLEEPSVFKQFTQELRIAAAAPDLFGYGYGVHFVTGVYFYDSTFATSDIFSVEDLGAAFTYITAANAGAMNNGVPPASIGGLAGAIGPGFSTLLPLLDPATSPFIGKTQSASVTLDQSAQQFAYFGQFEHLFLKHWALVGGLRYGVERKDARASSTAQGALVPLIADQEDHETQLSRIEHDLSPKAGFKWIPNDRFNAYFNWGQAYKSGGFNALPLNNRNIEYDRELATGYEVGAKYVGQLLDGPLRASLALFSTDYEDLQVSTFRGGSFVILNAAEARTRGFEFEAQWLPPIPNLMLVGSAGYARAYYLNYANAPARSDSDDATQDLKGKPLAFAPLWTANFAPAYSPELFQRFDTTFSLNISYRDDRFIDLDNDPRKFQRATTTIDMRTLLYSADLSWSLSLVGHNLTQEKISDQAISQPLAPGNFLATRTDYGHYWSLSLSYTFRPGY